MRLLFLSLAILTAPVPASAQVGDYEFVSDIGFPKIDEYNYANAIEFVSRELAQCVPERGEEACLRLTLRLAEASLWDIDYSRSLDLAREALAQVERYRPSGHPDHAVATYYLGKALFQVDRMGDAESLLRRSLTLAEALPDPGPVMLARRYSLLGEALDEQSRFGDAYVFHNRALNILRPVSEDEPQLIISVAMNWAYSLALNGAVDDVESYLVDILPQGYKSGIPDPAFAEGYYLLALIKLDRGDLDKALENAIWAAIGMGEVQIGESSPTAVRPIRLQAEIMAAKGWEVGARRHFVEALLLARKYLSETSRHRINAADIFGRYLLDNADALAEARTLIREAADGAIARSVQKRDLGTSELRDFRGIFTHQVEAAWRLANP